MIKIIVPKDNVSDEFYQLIQWLFVDGDRVRKGEVIALLETSKATIDIFAESDGFIFTNANSGDEVRVGSVLGVICSESIKPDFEHIGSNRETPTNTKNEKSSIVCDSNFSKKARQLIEKHKLDPLLFSDLSLVRESDVEKYLNKAHQPKSISNGLFPRIVVYGGGGLGKMIIDLIRQKGGYEIAGIIDDNLKVGECVMGVPVIGDNSKLETLYDNGIHFAALAIGFLDSNFKREKNFERCKEAKLTLPVLIHPKATVEPSALLGEGTLVFANAVVGSDSVIASNCIINSGAIISHDCSLKEGVHITPGAILAGKVQIGRYSLIGMGVTIFLGVEIGDKATVMNGCDIVNDIADNEVVLSSGAGNKSKN